LALEINSLKNEQFRNFKRNYRKQKKYYPKDYSGEEISQEILDEILIQQILLLITKELNLGVLEFLEKKN
jgi:hypothetical protein